MKKFEWTLPKLKTVPLTMAKDFLKFYKSDPFMAFMMFLCMFAGGGLVLVICIITKGAVVYLSLGMVIVFDLFVWCMNKIAGDDK